jgi:hypothetical protein
MDSNSIPLLLSYSITLNRNDFFCFKAAFSLFREADPYYRIQYILYHNSNNHNAIYAFLLFIRGIQRGSASLKKEKISFIFPLPPVSSGLCRDKPGFKVIRLDFKAVIFLSSFFHIERGLLLWRVFACLMVSGASQLFRRQGDSGLLFQLDNLS